MSASTTTKTDLLLLGLLLDRPMHGYELYQQIQTEGIDDWFNISAAGVYYSLRKLRDQGLVAESQQRTGGSTRKSIYRLTDDGRTNFFAAMEMELASRDQACLEYDLVIYLLNRLPWQRALPRLEERRSFLGEQIDQVRATLAAGHKASAPALKLAILEHKLAFLEMEQGWLADVIGGIQRESEAAYGSEREGQGLLVLGGDLRDLHLPDLFYLILAGQHSGTLKVTDGAETRFLVFDDGQPVKASYVRAGGARQIATTCDEVLTSLCELFGWREGRFSFDQRAEGLVGGVPLECSGEELILRGCRKVDNWAIIQRLVPSADTIFERGPAPRADHLVLTAAEERVLAEVDGVKNVAVLAREQDLTLFEASRICYCLAAIGLLHTADLDKILLRRVFREIAELMCRSTLEWRSSPDDRACEEEVNQRVDRVPIRLDHGRIEDQVDPQIETDELKGMYGFFLAEQYRVISRRFGRSNARQAFEQTLRQLGPELQDVAKRYGFDRVAES
jgi:DNA-binding PadR family transcriptional regulator